MCSAAKADFEEIEKTTERLDSIVKENVLLIKVGCMF